MLLHERLYTADEFWEFCQQPENIDKHLELIEGVIYEMSPGNWLHGKLIWLFTAYLSVYVLEHEAGEMTGAETGFRVAPNIILAPDIGFIVQARIPAEIPQKYVPFAPDLAVEVVSPGNTVREINHKTKLYLQYGTTLVWIVYPEQHEIHVYQAGQAENEATIKYLGEKDILSGDPILPNFTMPLAKLFTKPPNS